MATPKPKRIDDKLRSDVWERDKGTCQKCGKQLYKLIDPYEEVIEELQNLHEIKIFKWIHITAGNVAKKLQLLHMT